MEMQEADIHQLLKIRSEIDEEIRRHKTERTVLVLADRLGNPLTGSANPLHIA